MEIATNETTGTKRQTVYASIYVRYLQECNAQGQKQTVVTRRWEEGNAELVFNGVRVSVQEDENVLDLDGGHVCTTV